MNETLGTCHTRSRLCLSTYILFPMISSYTYYVFQPNLVHRNEYLTNELKTPDRGFPYSKHEEKTTYLYISSLTLAIFPYYYVLHDKFVVDG